MTHGDGPFKVNGEYVERFGALANHTRIRIVVLLAEAHHEVAAGTIQAALDVPAPTLSHHLNILRVAGLVQNRRDERHIYYTVRRAAILELARLLASLATAREPAQ